MIWQFGFRVTLISTLSMVLVAFKITQQDADEIKRRGDEITKASFQVLSQSLMGAMAKGGVSHAIKFCNTVAYPLTDSLSKAYQVSIRRTSLQWRNPTNKPTKWEQKVLKEYEQATKESRNLEAKAFQLRDGSWLYTKPIVLQPQCQVCHGKIGETLTNDNYQIIKNLYPNDKAIGFAAGDLRGMWVLKFSNAH